MTDPDLICVTKRMTHHGRYAGYSTLVPHLGAQRTIGVRSYGVSRWVGALSRRALAPLHVGSRWWGAHSAAAELLALAAARGASSVIHVLYGEDLLGLAGRRRSARRRVVATFHQPFARAMALGVPLGALAGLDAIVALDDHTADGWRAAMPGARVEALRLPVDTTFWTPGDGARLRRCLVVGGHLRDLEVLERVVAALAPEGIGFDLVGLPARFTDRLPPRAEVRVHRGIPDEALRDLYRRAGVFFLPLSETSGNNALLQALATGCPIVCTDVPGARSYVDEGCALFARRGRAEEHAEAVTAALASSERLAGAALERAPLFSLDAVARAHWALYRALG